MSCYGCMTEFGFWRKETGCAACDRIYCNKCVKHKIIVPKIDPKRKQAVCGTCFHQLSNTPVPKVVEVEPINRSLGVTSQKKTDPNPPSESTSQDETPQPSFVHDSSRHRQHTPPTAGVVAGGGPSIAQQQTTSATTTKDIGDEIQNRLKNITAGGAGNQHDPKNHQKLPRCDGDRQQSELENRLNELKKHNQDNAAKIASQSEIEERLAAVKGVDPNLVRHPGEYFRPAENVPSQSKKTEVEQTGDLITAMQAEVALDARMPTPEQDIAARLARLRGQEADNSEALPSNQDSPPSIVGNNHQQPLITNDPVPGSSEPESSTDESRDTELAKQTAEVNAMLLAAQQEAERDAQVAMDELAKDKSLQDELDRIRQENKDSIDKQNKLTKTLSQVGADGDDEKLLDSEDEDDNDEIDETTKRIIAEAELESRFPSCPTSSATADDNASSGVGMADRNKAEKVMRGNDEEDEEMPWCAVCTDDAVVRCSGCDDDLYCRRCFKEFHDPEDLKADHKWKPYKAPTSSAAEKKKKIETVV